MHIQFDLTIPVGHFQKLTDYCSLLCGVSERKFCSGGAGAGGCVFFINLSEVSNMISNITMDQNANVAVSEDLHKGLRQKCST